MTRRELTRHPAVRGICVGACVAGDEWAKSEAAAKRVVAHAHYAGRRKGWICIRRLAGYTAVTLRHEIAHLVRGNDRHDDAWRREIAALGGKVEASYRKRSA